MGLAQGLHSTPLTTAQGSRDLSPQAHRAAHPSQPPPVPRAHREQPGVQQQRVGSLRVVLVADVQVLQLVQVPGSDRAMCGAQQLAQFGHRVPSPCPSGRSANPILLGMLGTSHPRCCRCCQGCAHLMYMAWRSISL